MGKVIPLPLGIVSAFLIRDEGTVMVDTGMNFSRDRFVDLFSELGIDPREIRLVIITHGHHDHFFHLTEIKEITGGAPVLCHREAVEAIQTGRSRPVKPRNETGQQILEMLKSIPPPVYRPVTPDIAADEEIDLTRYGVKGRIIYTPGHTADSISVILDSGEAIVGDTLVSNPFTGRPEAAYLAEDEDALFRSIRTLYQNAEVFYGSHGGPFTREEVAGLLPPE